MTISTENLERGIDVLKKHIKTFPEKPGVYQMLSNTGNVLYVGKAKNLPKRVISYTKVDHLPIRLQRMVSLVHHVEIIVTTTELEALLLENNLIKKFKPPYNVLLKDDKSYPYIYLTDHPFPRIMKYRGIKEKKGQYFGPFADTYAVDEAILSIQKLFFLRNCSDNIFSMRKRPCLQYHIKRCTAPCVKKITPLDYKQHLLAAIQFLKGKTDFVQQQLSQEMQNASQQMDYEKAALIRDRLKLLSKIHHQQHIDVSDIDDADIIAIDHQHKHVVVQMVFYRYGRHFGTKSIFLTHIHDEDLPSQLHEFLKQFYLNHPIPKNVLLNIIPEDFETIKDLLYKHHHLKTNWDIPHKGIKKQLITDALKNATLSLERKLQNEMSMQKIFTRLQEVFQLDKIPQRIEVYDNSHIQGSHPVGVMIVANIDGFDKKSYRKFNLQKTKDFGGDDFAMMDEMLSRRFSENNLNQKPDLLLIDGGLGQFNRVKSVCIDKNIQVDVIGIAKGKDRNAGREFFFTDHHEPFQLDKNDPLLFFLQNIRDEAHRFAITTHRNKRIKAIKQSQLNDIPEVGPQRKKALLNHFGSFNGVKEASIQELENVTGISKNIAQKIYNFFHEK